MSLDFGNVSTNDQNTEGVNEDAVADNDVRSLLTRILKELKIMNMYNAEAMDQELTKDDIE